MVQYSGGGGGVAGVQGGYAPLDSGLHVPLQYLNALTPAQLTSAAGVVYGVYAKIAETILNAPAANVPFTSIPASFRHLKLFVLSRCDNAVTQNNLYLQFNGDTGANYDWENAIFFGTTAPQDAASIADTKINIGWSTAASATANKAAQSEVTVFQYAGTTFYKSVSAIGGLDRGTAAGDQFTFQTSGLWLSTAAITSILVFPAAGNFITGSMFSLYGIQ